MFIAFFDRIKVAYRRALFDATNGRNRPGLEQQRLDECRFARAGVTHQRDSSKIFGRIAGHVVLLVVVVGFDHRVNTGKCQFVVRSVLHEAYSTRVSAISPLRCRHDNNQPIRA